MATYHFFPLILRPTRITPTTATLIDNFFTNSLNSVIDSAIITSEISDHLPIITWTNNVSHTLHNIGKTEMKRNFTDETSATFRNNLSNIDWNPVLHLCNENEPDMAYNLFLKMVRISYDEAFPLKPIKISKSNTFHQPWMTRGLLKSTKKRKHYTLNI